MSKKRILLISLPLIAVLVVVFPLVAKAEYAKAYAVCENRMLSVESYGSAWVYQRTELNIGNLPLLGRSLHEKTGLVFVFNGCGVASCSVYRDWSGWHEGNVWQQGTCLP